MVIRNFRVQKLFRFTKNPYFKSLTTEAGVQSESGIQQKVLFRPSKTMKQYFSDRGLTHILEQVPALYARCNSNQEYCILADPKVARRIAYEICCRVEGKYIMEFDPGFGFMSEVLTTATSHLGLFEPNEELRSKLQNNFSGKVDIFDINFRQLIIFSITNEEYWFKKVPQIFEKLPMSSTDEIKLTSICTVMRFVEMRLLCVKMIFNPFLQKFGRWEYYFLIPGHVYKKLIASPENEFSDQYTYGSVLFQTIFDFEVLLDHLPRNVFLPWAKNDNTTEDCVLLLRAVPKLDILNTFQNEESWTDFVVFLKDSLRLRRRVIAQLELYMPECGPDFIFDFDLTNYTEFLELPPKKLLAMFFALSKSPGFLSSNRNSPTFDNITSEISEESEDECDEDVNDIQEYQINGEMDGERNYYQNV